MERLQKIIAASGITSRRKAEELIVQGRVKVDGEIITQLGYQAKKGAVILVDGKQINKENKVYYVMNKPKNTLCTLHDEHDRPTIMDFINVEERIFPVGRLDFDTTGVLILTNDGEFANEIIHPSSHLEKTYEVSINGILTGENLKMLEKGILLEDGITLPARANTIAKNIEKGSMLLELTIQEGRNRQVKRMIEYFGFEVKRLNRKRLGSLMVNDLKPGQVRLLKPFEVKQLRQLAKEGK
ncbi:MAG: pseudouridine synthase [Anaerorhabdus sp.]|uniref:pseudouridine synthase n=1 Tax=Anaerorhabdus sp. TaxID=1872524 RepID=UPI002FCC94A4